MATERITIIVEDKNTVTVRKNFDNLGGKIDAVGAKMNSLKQNALSLGSVFGGLVAALSVGAFIKYSDAALRLSNTLKLAGLEGEAFTSAQERLYQAGIQNGQQAEALGSIYQKLSANQSTLKGTSEDFLGVTEGIAAAMRLSSASTSAQEGALQQLSQAFGGTKIQAEEYNSLVDGAYPLLQAAANASDQFGGSVGKLTAAVKSGSISTKQFFDLLKVGLKDTQAIAAAMPLSIGQAVTSVEQSFIRFLANSQSASAGARMLSGALVFVAQNMDSIANIVVPLAGLIGAGLLVTAITSATTALYGMATGLTAAAVAAGPLLIAAAPFIALGVAIAGAVTIGYQLIDWLLAGTQAWEAFKASAVSSVQGVIDVLSTVFTLTGGGTGAPAKIEIQADKAADRIEESYQTGAKLIDQSGGRAGGAMQNGILQASDVGSTAMRGAITDASEFAASGMRGSIENGGQAVATSWTQTFANFIQGLYNWAASFFTGANSAAKASEASKPGSSAGASYGNSGAAQGGGTDGTEAAAKIAEAFRTGGSAAARDLVNSMSVGGREISKEFAASNAKVADGLRAKLIDGGDGAAKSIGGGMSTGGSSAGSSIGESMRNSGREAGDYIADRFQSAAQAGAAAFQAMADSLGLQAGTKLNGKTNQFTGEKYLQTPDGMVSYFARGGAFKVGGSGGTDSQPVKFMASPDERVTVETPAQVKARESAMAGANRPASSGPTKIINKVDPRSFLDAVNTREGRDTVINNIRINPQLYRRALGLS